VLFLISDKLRGPKNVTGTDEERNGGLERPESEKSNMT
jgi:hypothetical protein